jgi:hypothetical protein
MCDLIGKTQSADNLRSIAGLSTCYRPNAEFLEQHVNLIFAIEIQRQQRKAFDMRNIGDSMWPS